MATYQRGVVAYMGATGSTYGLRQSMSETVTGETATALDENGETAAYDNYDKRAEFSMEIVVDTGGTLPDFGDNIAMVGTENTGLANVQNVAITESNTDYKTATIDATQWVANSLPT